MSITKDFGTVNINIAELFKKELGNENLTTFWHGDLTEVGILKDIFRCYLNLNRKSNAWSKISIIKLGTDSHVSWVWKRMPTTVEEKIELTCCNLVLQEVSLTFSVDKWKWTANIS